MSPEVEAPPANVPNVALEPEATPPPAPAAPAPAPAVPDGADPYEAGVESFDRPYVTKLREENAKRRTEAKAYDEVFGETDQETRDYLLKLSQGLLTDPKTTAHELVDIAKQVLGDDWESALNPEQPLT